MEPHASGTATATGGGKAHQLEVLARDRLELQEAVDQVGGQKQRLRHQLRVAALSVMACLRFDRVRGNLLPASRACPCTQCFAASADVRTLNFRCTSTSQSTKMARILSLMSVCTVAAGGQPGHLHDNEFTSLSALRSACTCCVM